MTAAEDVSRRTADAEGVAVDLDGFRTAVDSEGLRRWLVVGRPDGVAAHRVCVYEAGPSWELVISDERAGAIEATRRRFDDGSEALEAALASARKLRDILG